MPESGSSSSRLVYTSEEGRICPGCEKPQDRCVCKKSAKERQRIPSAKPPSPGKAAGAGGTKPDGIIRIGREVNGRGGKTVSTISGVPLDGKLLQELAGELKRRCGTGGTVKDWEILIQGDKRKEVGIKLEKEGYKYKLAGG